MTFSPTHLDGSYTVQLQPVQDARGWFARTYSKDEFRTIGHSADWVQMNHSFTKIAGTVRGMHYQMHPHKEIKLVRCVRGVVYDVIIDLRKDSSSFLKWFGVELSAVRMNMIYIPEGFAHGFQTLVDDCELLYSHTAFYNAGAERGIMFNDPVVGINWPMEVCCVSERDNSHLTIKKNFKGI